MFLHSYHPSPIFLDLNFIQIHWYGFLITLAGLAGFFVFYKLTRAYRNTPLQKIKLNSAEILNLFFWLIIAAIIGGRLYHVFSEFNYYWQHPLQIFYLWQGGLGIFGSIIAAVLVILYFSKKITKKKYLLYSNHKIPFYSVMLNLFQHLSIPRLNCFLRSRNKFGMTKQVFSNSQSFYLTALLLLDFLAPAFALGQAIGRWGNYFNQELYGLPTNLPWGIPIDFANRLQGYENFTFFQPLFLYESLFCLMLFFFLINIICHSDANQNPEKKNLISFWFPTSVGMTKKRNLAGMTVIKTPGNIFLLYLFSYSLWRFFIEFLRIDPQPVFLNLRLGQWVSAGLIILSVFLYLWKSHLTNTKNVIK